MKRRVLQTALSGIMALSLLACGKVNVGNESVPKNTEAVENVETTEPVNNENNSEYETDDSSLISNNSEEYDATRARRVIPSYSCVNIENVTQYRDITNNNTGEIVGKDIKSSSTDGYYYLNPVEITNYGYTFKISQIDDFGLSNFETVEKLYFRICTNGSENAFYYGYMDLQFGGKFYGDSVGYSHTITIPLDGIINETVTEATIEFTFDDIAPDLPQYNSFAYKAGDYGDWTAKDYGENTWGCTLGTESGLLEGYCIMTNEGLFAVATDWDGAGMAMDTDNLNEHNNYYISCITGTEDEVQINTIAFAPVFDTDEDVYLIGDYTPLMYLQIPTDTLKGGDSLTLGVPSFNYDDNGLIIFDDSFIFADTTMVQPITDSCDKMISDTINNLPLYTIIIGDQYPDWSQETQDCCITVDKENKVTMGNSYAIGKIGSIYKDVANNGIVVPVTIASPEVDGISWLPQCLDTVKAHFLGYRISTDGGKTFAKSGNIIIPFNVNEQYYIGSTAYLVLTPEIFGYTNDNDIYLEFTNSIVLYNADMDAMSQADDIYLGEIYFRE